MEHLSQAELALYQSRLEDELTSCKQSLIKILKHAPVTPHWLAQIATMSSSALVDALEPIALNEIGQPLQHLKQIDAALCQMDMGLFGICSDCEEMIEADILAAQVTAQRCQKCQQNNDNKHGFIRL
ncbi:TraR/DksA family transcriptional regulator [Motilimonas pumila]|uniref:Uncharacterized protein n=1 Tax=Motilimonas pumila TaxID=2303987 RepID=A0A418YCH3_9GAMM|nr:hypothetical protein [Motilimonas pumila]RJG42229.1 hypothetical protein D1Z90_14085 [Motilimonas pumila]